MSHPYQLVTFPDRNQASEAAAKMIADAIRKDAETGKDSRIVVSGGSTPGPCFDRLSTTSLDWQNVTVVPSDERWVPGDHPDSNERLIRNRLLHNQAAAGRFLPLYRGGMEPDDAIPLISQDLDAVSAPFSSVLLGMGEDGHIASLFPDFQGLERALDPNLDSPCLAVRTAGSPYLRISLSLSALLNSESTILLIFGQPKRQVLDAAVAGDTRYPVESLLRHCSPPLTVLWAP